MLDPSHQERGEGFERAMVGSVQMLPNGVRSQLDPQTGAQAWDGLGPMPLQSEAFLELSDDHLDDLAQCLDIWRYVRSDQTRLCRRLGCSNRLDTKLLFPLPLPPCRAKALVCQVCGMPLL